VWDNEIPVRTWFFKISNALSLFSFNIVRSFSSRAANASLVGARKVMDLLFSCRIFSICKNYQDVEISSHDPRVWLYNLTRSSKMTLTSVPLIKSFSVEYFSSVSMSCIIVLLGGIKSWFTSCTVDPQVFSSKPINLAQLIVARLMTLVKSGN